jgi:hypothetical protein
MRAMAAWLGLFVGACGAAAAPERAVVAPPPTPPPPTSVEASLAPEVASHPPPVDLGGSVATIAIETVPDGTHVHACRFTIVSGQFAGWLCGATPSSTSYPLTARASEELATRLAAVDDWGTPTPDDAPPVPIAITLYGDRTIAHRHVDPDAEPPALAAFRIAAMAAAQEGLAILRERAEACATCDAGHYCEEGWQCSTMGPDGKNCERVVGCERRLPATSACEHHYQCASRRCDGTTEAIGHCAT